MLTTPRELVLELPPRLQALVGYTPAGGLGHSNVGPAAKLLAPVARSTLALDLLEEMELYGLPSTPSAFTVRVRARVRVSLP